MFSLVSICLLTRGKGTHVIITHGALDPTVKGPPEHGTSLYPSPTWDLTVQPVAPLPCPTSADIWWLRSGREVGGTHVTGMVSCAVIFCIHKKLRSAI